LKTDEAGICSLVAGTITIYAEEEASKDRESIKWAIFKRMDGDPFLFRDLFEAIGSHK
jgi:cobyric acid synthase